MRNILVVVAHPDDEILGAGGVMSKYKQNKALIFSQGRKDPIDQKFETKPITYFISEIERAVNELMIETVYTHIWNDINKDHQIIHEAVRVACRPTKSNVTSIYGFDSTLSPMNTFNPTYFERLDKKDIMDKVRKMKEKYEKEMNMPYREKDGIYAQAKYWGSQIGVDYAEAFEVIMQIK